MDPSTRSLRSLGRDDSLKRRSALSVGVADWGASVGTNGRNREEGVIPSGAAGGVEESVEWAGPHSLIASTPGLVGRSSIQHPISGWAEIQNSKLKPETGWVGKHADGPAGGHGAAEQKEVAMQLILRIICR
jgi:hypothetical protein